MESQSHRLYATSSDRRRVSPTFANLITSQGRSPLRILGLIPQKALRGVPLTGLFRYLDPITTFEVSSTDNSTRESPVLYNVNIASSTDALYTHSTRISAETQKLLDCRGENLYQCLTRNSRFRINRGIPVITVLPVPEVYEQWPGSSSSVSRSSVDNTFITRTRGKFSNSNWGNNSRHILVDAASLPVHGV